MKPNLSVDAKKFINDLGSIKASVRRAGIRDGLDAGGYVIEANAKIKAPVDTGFLRNSIMVSEIKAENTGGYAIVAVIAENAAHLEYGTIKMAAQPYLRPAVYDNEAAIHKAVSAALISAIESAV